LEEDIAMKNLEQARSAYSESKKSLKNRKRVLRSWVKATRRAECEDAASNSDYLHASEMVAYSRLRVLSAEMQHIHNTAVLKNVRRVKKSASV
jgi:hypothetical protein